MSSDDVKPLNGAMRSVLERLKGMPAYDRDDGPVDADEAKRIAAGRWADFLRDRGHRYEQADLSAPPMNPRHAEVIEALREYANDMPAAMQSGQNIMLFGPTGTGKDWLLVALAKIAIGRGQRVLWQNGQTLFARARDAMDSGRSELDLIGELAAAPVLILSDPLPVTMPSAGQAAAISQHQANLLFSVLDKRANFLRPTWVTLNVENRAEATARLGAANLSRLIEDALLCWCSWKSFRQPKRVVGKDSAA